MTPEEASAESNAVRGIRDRAKQIAAKCDEELKELEASLDSAAISRASAHGSRNGIAFKSFEFTKEDQDALSYSAKTRFECDEVAARVAEWPEAYQWRPGPLRLRQFKASCRLRGVSMNSMLNVLADAVIAEVLEHVERVDRPTQRPD